MDRRKLDRFLNSTISSRRLQSLKLPRDFNLARSKPKKVFTPNLNVVRNKDKTKELINGIDNKRKEKIPHKNERIKSENKSRFVQSTGIFSQGSAEIQRSNLRSERRYIPKDRESISNITVPIINRNTRIINQKAENLVLDELLNCDYASEEDELAYKPLTLQTSNNSESLVQIKKDPAIPNFSNNDFSKCLVEPFNRSDILNDANPSTCIVKLPFSLGGKVSADSDIKILSDYTLTDMLEGKIGKLRIRKSGKMEVQIGNIKYELLPKAPTEFKEELCLIEDNGNDGKSLSELNLIDNKFDLVPDFSQLLS